MRPTLNKVEPLNGYKLKLLYNNGECKVYDCTDFVDEPVFKSLKNMAIFNTAKKIRIDSGVEFINGIDICPDDLYYGSKSL